ncbi:DUF6262 family protein [Clostridium perfringens]|uniref:DUF6262 family protein n=1 Tax=Clostridium perfringens TaxID=1502 RepID=UPI0018E48557|nr:DUF6262 family protein [Clostridium perfringens]MBI6001203.1 hypothetical protein [Clostridium perfringens]
MSDKTTKIRELAKEKSEKRKAEVIKIIKLMIKNGESVSFYSVNKKSGASKSYLYNNEEIYNLIKEARGKEVEKKKTTESKDSIINMLNLKIKKLESEIKSLKEENSDSYKLKYEKVLEENFKLKEQLKNSYNY